MNRSFGTMTISKLLIIAVILVQLIVMFEFAYFIYATRDCSGGGSSQAREEELHDSPHSSWATASLGSSYSLS